MTVAENQAATALSAGQTAQAERERPFDTIIEPRRGWTGLDLPEMLRFRELLYFLVWRDVKVRYKQTVLGVAWAILQPIFNVVLFTWVFGSMAGLNKNLPPGSPPFALWIYGAQIPWQLISTGLLQGGLSLVNAQNMISKVYFPRLFAPSATVGGALVDMSVSVVVFALLIVAYHAHVQWTLIFVPFLLVLTIMVALGFAYLLSAMTLTYRDVKFLMPFLGTLLMYSGCIMIPAYKFHERAHLILSVNPVFGICNAWRSAIFGLPWRFEDLAISAATATLLFLVGLFYFRTTERRFADIA